MKRIIKLMPEYECYSIWISEKNEIFKNIHPKTLGLSDELQKRLDKWENRFESTFNKKNPSNSGFKNKEEEITFEEEGKNIWKNIIKELKDPNIIYCSIKKKKNT